MAIPIRRRQEGDDVSEAINQEPEAPILPEVKSKVCWFWMIWAENGGAPTAVHITEERAIREVERLARKVPGKRFYLMKGYRIFKVKGARRGAPETQPEETVQC